MSDGDALLRGVLLRPDDDTARLVYADWLQENGDEPRAEFVRLQVRDLPAAHRALDDCSMRDLHFTDPEKASAAAELKRLRERQGELLGAHGREWSRVLCPVCKGHYRQHMQKKTPPADERVCGACAATGFASVRWSRGFVETVLCRMSDVLRETRAPCPECNPRVVRAGVARCSQCAPGGDRVCRTWSLTPWASSVLNAHPVARWEIADYAPASGYAFDDGYGFFASALPAPVFAEIHGHAHCATERDAMFVLANGVGRAARSLAGLPALLPVPLSRAM